MIVGQLGPSALGYTLLKLPLLTIHVIVIQNTEAKS